MDLTLNSYAIMQKGNGNKLKKVEGELLFCKQKLYPFHNIVIS